MIVQIRRCCSTFRMRYWHLTSARWRWARKTDHICCSVDDIVGSRVWGREHPLSVVGHSSDPRVGIGLGSLEDLPHARIRIVLLLQFSPSFLQFWGQIRVESGMVIRCCGLPCDAHSRSLERKERKAQYVLGFNRLAT